MNKSSSDNYLQWQEDTAKQLLLVTRRLAKLTVKRFPTNAQLDYEAFISAGDEAITEIVNNPANRAKPIEELQALCTIATSRRIKDEQRHILGKRQRKPDTTSLDNPSSNDDNYHAMVFTENDSIKAVDIRDAILHLKRLLSFLPSEQYNIICAEIDYRPQGLSQPEIARKLGKNVTTYRNMVVKIREKIDRLYPEVVQAIDELLLNDTNVPSRGGAQERF